MAEEKSQAIPEESLKSGYEVRDTNLRYVLWFAIALVVALFIISVAVGLLYGFFSARQTTLSPPPPPLLEEAEEAELEPPQPRLQRVPGADLEQMRTIEDSILNSYGWVDEEAGVTRIPIDRAMELMLERGLPTRSQSEENE